MVNETAFRVSAWWTSGRTGIAKSDNSPTAIHFSAPLSFGGQEGRWTPEELLLSALASCLTTTFHAIATYSKLQYSDLEVVAEGSIAVTESGYQFTHMKISPRLTILNESDRELASRVLHKSEKLCLISRALSTPQVFQPEILTAVSASVG